MINLTDSLLDRKVDVRISESSLLHLQQLARQVRVRVNGAERQATASDIVRMAIDEFVVMRRMEPMFSDPIGVPIPDAPQGAPQPPTLEVPR